MKMNMKFTSWMGLLSLVILLAISGCNGENVSTSTNTSSNVSTSTESSTSSNEPRVVKTYVNWSFDNLNVGDEIPNTASEGAGFSAYRKDEQGNVWVRSNNPKDWAAFYFGTPNENGEEIFLKDFAIETVAYLPSVNDGSSNDGGIALLVGSTGRYDSAVYFGEDSSSVNLWHAGNTDGGPIATTQNKEDWGYRGSKADSLALYPDNEYKITVAGKYQGMNEDGDEYWTLFVFIDDRLVIEQKDIAYWTGGFGLRGWQSAIEYSYVKVTDFPLICPDGKNHYNGETGGDYEPNKIATPVISLSENVVSWSAIESAVGYKVLVNDKVVTTTTDTSYTLEYTEVGEYVVAVRAVAAGKAYNSELSNEVTYIVEPAQEAQPLATPSIVLTGNTFSWNAIENAAGYIVNINGKQTDIIGTSYQLNTGLAGDYVVTVKAKASGTEYLDSEYSNAATLTVAEGTQKSYLNWNFSDVADGTDMPYVAVEGDGFKVVEDSGKKWATSKNTGDWAAVYFGVSDNGSEVFLTDYMMQATVKVPETSSAADGGFCIGVGAAGRYDVALYLNGAGSSINLWKAGDTNNGPKATTQKNASWGDLGSKVDSLNLTPGQEYTFTIIVDTAEDGQTLTFYAFVDNVLAIEKSGLPVLTGGFGLRAWQSSMLYTNIRVTDLPTLSPDGISRFN